MMRCSSLALAAAVALVAGPAGAIAMATSQEPSSPVVADGEPWIVYQLYDGSLRLRMVRPDGTGDHEAVPEVPGNQTHPDWSPDGERIAFVVDERQIWLADADGSDASAILDCQDPCALIDAPAWAPDGRSIAFMRLLFPPGQPGQGVVQVIDLETGEERTVFAPEAGFEAAWYMRWAPDGERMVISLEHYPSEESNTIDGSVIAVIDLTDPEAPPLRLTDRSMFASYPDWSPDGTRIVFATYDLGFRDFGNFADVTPPSNLYTIAPDGTGLERVTANEPGPTLTRNQTASGDLAGQPTWTPDGERILFVRVTGNVWPGWQMASIAPDASGLMPATGASYLMGTHPRLRPGQ